MDRADQRQVYLDDTYCTKLVSEVVARGVADGRTWIAPRENIFHPQGGGQPADSGTAAGLAVAPRWSAEVAGRVDLVLVDEGDGPDGPSGPDGAAGAVAVPAPGDPVELIIDQERRLRHAALHTAGHLVDAAIRRQGYRHLVSNHFPDEARIEFATDGHTDDLDALRQLAQAEVAQAIAADVPVTTTQNDEGRRVVVIGSYSTDVCGGTHVATSGNLTGVEIRSVKVKKGRLKVSYTAEHTRG